MVFRSSDGLCSHTLYVSVFLIVKCRLCTYPKEVLQVTSQAEILIDVVWLINMFVCFFTAFYRDIELVTNWKEIVKKYLKEGFAIDFVTTVPTLVTVYQF